MEILKLKELLEKNNVPFEFKSKHMDGDNQKVVYELYYPSSESKFTEMVCRQINGLITDRTAATHIPGHQVEGFAPGPAVVGGDPAAGVPVGAVRAGLIEQEHGAVFPAEQDRIPQSNAAGIGNDIGSLPAISRTAGHPDGNIRALFPASARPCGKNLPIGQPDQG